MKVVNAIFRANGQTYSYLVPEGDTPEVGDLIVTSTCFTQQDYDAPYAKANIDGTNVARVVSVSENITGRATKFYLALVPRVIMVDRWNQTKQFADRVKERDRARKALDAMLEESGRLAMYEALARNNPKAAELLEILR